MKTVLPEGKAAFAFGLSINTLGGEKRAFFASLSMSRIFNANKPTMKIKEG